MKKLFLFLSIFIFSCEKNNNIIDSTLPQMGVISLNYLSPKVINTDSIFVNSNKNLEDSLKLYFSIRINSSNTINNLVFNIKNLDNPDYNYSDQIISDLTYNNLSQSYDGKFSISIKRKDIGLYQMNIYSTDPNGNINSNHIITNFKIESYNIPPQLISVNTPDTIAVVDESLSFRLTAQVIDENGLIDIKNVQFNTYKPDASPSNNNPFSMFDDGNVNGMSGDLVKSDGIYSLMVSIIPQAQKGKYTFEFTAIDKSNAKSNTIIKYIVVK